MMTVRITCRMCGTADLDPEQVDLHVLESGIPVAVFEHCGYEIRRSIRATQMMQLHVAGCELIDWRVPMQWLEEARS